MKWRQSSRQKYSNVRVKQQKISHLKTTTALRKYRRRLVRLIPLITALILTFAYFGRKTTIPHGEYITKKYGFREEFHPLNRSDRFPSIEDRIKIYMSNWYLPPCDGTRGSPDERIRYQFDSSENERFPNITLSDNNGKHVANLDTMLRPDVPVVLWENALWKRRTLLGKRKTCLFPHFKSSYCPDIRNILEMVRVIRNTLEMTKPMNEMQRLENSQPIIGQFGDRPTTILQHSHVPIIKKYRHAATETDLNAVTSSHSSNHCGVAYERQKLGLASYDRHDRKGSPHDTEYSPIIMALNTSRHLNAKLLAKVTKYDVPWEKKKNSGVWRGLLTGKEGEEGVTFAKDCYRIPRCRFVQENLESKLVDAGVSYQLKSLPIDTVSEKNMIKGNMNLQCMLKYKVIIIIEGNDVASGLKWALYSRSVVLMAPPTKTSFAMEEYLKPWVHYVPLKSDISNAEEMIRWIVENDEKARLISERATLFMHDLLFHEKSAAENEFIQEEILERYMNFFVEIDGTKK